MNIVGEFSVLVEYENKEYTLVIKGSGAASMGRNWLGQIKLNWLAQDISYLCSYKFSG